MAQSRLLSENQPQNALFEFGQKLGTLRERLKTGSNLVLTEFETAQSYLSQSNSPAAKAIIDKYFTHDNQLNPVKWDLCNQTTRPITLAVIDAYLTFLVKIEESKNSFLKGWKYFPTVDEQRIENMRSTLTANNFKPQEAPTRTSAPKLHGGYGAL